MGEYDCYWNRSKIHTHQVFFWIDSCFLNPVLFTYFGTSRGFAMITFTGIVELLVPAYSISDHHRHYHYNVIIIIITTLFSDLINGCSRVYPASNLFSVAVENPPQH